MFCVVVIESLNGIFNNFIFQTGNFVAVFDFQIKFLLLCNFSYFLVQSCRNLCRQCNCAFLRLLECRQLVFRRMFLFLVTVESFYSHSLVNVVIEIPISQ